MRGRCRRARSRGAQNRGEAPSPSLRSISPRARGEMKMHSRSRRAIRARVMPTPSSRTIAACDRRQTFPAVAAGWLRSLWCTNADTSSSLRGVERRSNPGAGCMKRWIASLSLATTKETKKEAERRKAQTSNHRALRCGAAPAGAARLSAFHRGSRQRDVGPQGSASGHASWDLAGAFDPVRPPQPGGGNLAPLHGITRAAPVPVQRSTSRTGRCAGRLMPEPPECASDEPTPADTALAPPTGVTGWRPSRARFESGM